MVKDTVTLAKDIMQVLEVLKGLSKFASMAPGAVGALFSVINVVLVFLPQEDKVLIEVKAGFAEVNRKLDSLSIQLSSLATDVEWFNYVSVYFQDEMRILNAWKKFDEFRENSGLVQSQEEELRLTEIFTNYYEYTGTEASVANLYYYLTVSGTSFIRNINDLLRKKFNCDISEIGKYNLYLNSLLFKGIVLNQFYWRLKDFNSPGKEAKHSKMFNEVYRVQRSAVNFCLNNHKEYMKKDVLNISNFYPHDNKPAIANGVKMFLDKKYSWYSWVVVVFDTNQENKFSFYDMTPISVGKITVAVGHTLKAKDEKDEAMELIKYCLQEKIKVSCSHFETLQKCSRFPEAWGGASVSTYLSDFAKLTHVVIVKEGFIKVPVPYHQGYCKNWQDHHISFHLSRTVLVCNINTCHNGGQCERLLDSNEWLCTCTGGYYGDTCEHKMASVQLNIKPNIPTNNNKLKTMDTKLDTILCTLSPSSCYRG